MIERHVAHVARTNDLVTALLYATMRASKYCGATSVCKAVAPVFKIVRASNPGMPATLDIKELRNKFWAAETNTTPPIPCQKNRTAVPIATSDLGRTAYAAKPDTCLAEPNPRP
jgi:hypothetical protein